MVLGFDLLGGLFCGAAFELSNTLFHLFARFEGDHKFFGNQHLFACARVASFPSSPPLDLKNAEIPQFDTMVFHQRIDDRIERLLDDF